MQNLYIDKLDKIRGGIPATGVGSGTLEFQLWRPLRLVWVSQQFRFAARGGRVFNPIAAPPSASLLYGRGFRNPNASELFFNDGKQDEGNLNLRPEHADTFEVALDRRFLRLETAFSAYHVDDKSVIIPAYTADNLIQFQNAARLSALAPG